LKLILNCIIIIYQYRHIYAQLQHGQGIPADRLLGVPIPRVVRLEQHVHARLAEHS